MGKKKALLIGINYYNYPNPLKGCIEDVKRIKQFLIANGFKDDPYSIVCLTDDQTVPYNKFENLIHFQRTQISFPQSKVF